MPERTVLTYKELPFNSAQWQRLNEAIQPDRVVTVSEADAPDVARALADAEIAIITGNLDQRYVDAPKLKWVHCNTPA